MIWHTQGSGKSLTMVFLVRKLRTMPELRRFKVVVVTDRKDLEKQLSETATLTGETVRGAPASAASVAALARRKGPGCVFAHDPEVRAATRPASAADGRRSTEVRGTRETAPVI